MRPAFLLGFLLVVSSWFLFQGAVGSAPPWEFDYQLAVQRARQEEKPLLIYLHTVWCGYCDQMERTTFRNSKVQQAMAERQVWVKLDAERDSEGVRLNREFSVRGYPTILILDAEEREVNRLQGYLSADGLLQSLEQPLQDLTTFQSLSRLALESPDSAQAQYALAEKLLERNDFRAAAGRLREVIRLDGDGSNGLLEKSHYLLAFSLASQGKREEALSELRSFEKAFPKSEVGGDVLVLEGQILYYRGEGEQARAVFDRFLEGYPNHPDHFWVSQLVREIDSDQQVLLLSH